MANVSYVPSISPRNNATSQMRRRTNQNVSAIVDTADGLSGVQEQLAQGVSGIVTLAKITGGGMNGSLTVTNGLITGIVEPT